MRRFVAMSFDGRFDERFTEVIKPAIEGEEIGGRSLRAHRVNLSKSGESILTEITDGIVEKGAMVIGGSLKLRGADAAPMRPIAIPID